MLTGSHRAAFQEEIVMRCVVTALTLSIGFSLAIASSALAPVASAQPTPTTNATSTDLMGLFPSLAQVPPGMRIAENGSRPADEIAATFPDPADAGRQLAAWGWQENAYRTSSRRLALGPKRQPASRSRFTCSTGRPARRGRCPIS